MNGFDYDLLLQTLGMMQERLRNLEENEYITAYYKGYSNEGFTLEEIKDEILSLTQEIKVIENQLFDLDNEVL
jgi:hypothetical protein